MHLCVCATCFTAPLQQQVAKAAAVMDVVLIRMILFSSDGFEL